MTPLVHFKPKELKNMNPSFSQSTKIINLRKHPIHILQQDKVVETYPSYTGAVPKIITSKTPKGKVGNTPIMDITYVECVNLPPPQENILYIVSSYIAKAFPQREDLVVPHLVRDKNGKVLGASMLTRHKINSL